MKTFNTAGPVNRPGYYKIDPLKRWDLEHIRELIDTERYFILHAPRQTGKTSCLRALQEYLNNEGNYFAIFINVESASVARHDISKAIKAIVTMLKDELKQLKVDNTILNRLFPLFDESDAEAGLKTILSYLSAQIPKPIVLLIDEIDAVVGDSLISVLRQLRSGYDSRPAAFPSSVMLCGVRDMRDYRIQTSGMDIITGGSAFNIKDESLRLGDFTKEEVAELLTQHTTETGQKWQEGCFEKIFQYTSGQPWLVNAFGREVAFDMKENRNRSVLLTLEMIDIAKENIIITRRTHIQQLSERLREDRICRVIEATILGDTTAGLKADDLEYCADLGLIKKVGGVYKLSNEIYAEVIPRELNQLVQMSFIAQFTAGWLAPDGSLDIRKLLTMFKDFWVENSHIWREKIEGYLEAAPHLVIQAFLQRIVNGGGNIRREYALDSCRFDIFITWDYLTATGAQTQKFIIELKTYSTGQKYDTVRKEALLQTARYAHTCGISDNSHIIVFNRHFQGEWDTDAPNECVEFDGVKMEIWKM